MNDSRASLESLTNQVEAKVQNGMQGVVLQLLDEHPQLADDDELVIELIYREFLAIEAQGSCDRDSFLELYPRWRSRLDRVLKIHDVMDETSLGTPATTGTVESLESPNLMASPLPDFHLDRYEVMEKLGQGSVGTVYRARCRQLERIVALKVIQTDVEPVTVRRFFREAETIAKLQHPHIVQIYDAHQGDDFACLALEFVDGGSLAEQLKDQRIEPRASAELMLKVALAVETAHKAGVIHRDLKPANILLTKEGQPKLADFGLAKQLESTTIQQTQSGAILGTPAYMAPEQARGEVQETGPATDVHAMGAILYELLAGAQPFQGEAVYDVLQQIVDSPATPPSRSQPGIARDLETVCLKCLEKDPLARYPTAEALAGDLGRFLAGNPILAQRGSVFDTAWKWCRRQPVVAALTIALLTLVLFFGIYASQKGASDSQAQKEKPQPEKLIEDDPETARRKSLRKRSALLYTSMRDAQSDVGLNASQRRLADKAAYVWGPLINKGDASNQDLIRAADTLYFAGKSLRLSGRWRSALIALNAGVKATKKIGKAIDSAIVDRLHAELLVELGKTYEHLNRTPDALPCFSEAAELLKQRVAKQKFAFDKYLWGQAVLGQVRVWRGDGRIADARKSAKQVDSECVPTPENARQPSKLHRLWSRDLAARRSLKPDTVGGRNFAEWLAFQLQDCRLQAQEELGLLAAYEENRPLALHHIDAFPKIRSATDGTESRHLQFPFARSERVAALVCATFGSSERAKNHYAESVRRFGLCGNRPGDFELQKARLQSRREVGLLYKQDGNSNELIRHFQSAAEILVGLIDDFPEQRRGHRRLAYEINLELAKQYDVQGDTVRQLKACLAVRKELFEQPFQSEAEKAKQVFQVTRDVVVLRAIAGESPARSPDSSILANQLVKQQPESASSWNGKAAAHYNAREYPEAIAAARKALSLSANDLQGQMWLAMSLWKTGQREMARSRLELALAGATKLKPKSATARVVKMATDLIKTF